MSGLDFKEIPEAHLGGGKQDTFELFARDFLVHLGYKIDEEPNRGADGGKDIAVTEKRSGVGGETIVRWLVSCKHHAHSGASVTPHDELNIRDRVEANKCHGFFGFYSTLMSSGLADMIAGFAGKIETQVFDYKKIESYLLKTVAGAHLAKRYFPLSMKSWLDEHPKPATVFEINSALLCKNCGKNLLEPKPSGIIVIWHRLDTTTGKTHREEVYWCCKGHCDQALAIGMRGRGFVDRWEDIPDVAIPLVFARWMMSPLNQLYRGETYSKQAFESLKEFILSVYPFVARNASPSETQRIERLRSIPAFLGGLG